LAGSEVSAGAAVTVISETDGAGADALAEGTTVSVISDTDGAGAEADGTEEALADAEASGVRDGSAVSSVTCSFPSETV
jgi:hypothetical protein